MKTKNMILTALFIAIGLVLPMLFHSLGIASQIFSPMHYPVLLAGLLLGWRSGLLVGILTPLLSSMLTGMPPLFPVAVTMMLELAVYGTLSGYLYKNKQINLILALIIAMVLGRFVSGLANYAILVPAGKAYTLQLFMAAHFIKPAIGILFQLILIPILAMNPMMKKAFAQ